MISSFNDEDGRIIFLKTKESLLKKADLGNLRGKIYFDSPIRPCFENSSRLYLPKIRKHEVPRPDGDKSLPSDVQAPPLLRGIPSDEMLLYEKSSSVISIASDVQDEKSIEEDTILRELKEYKNTPIIIKAFNRPEVKSEQLKPKSSKEIYESSSSIKRVVSNIHNEKNYEAGIIRRKLKGNEDTPIIIKASEFNIPEPEQFKPKSAVFMPKSKTISKPLKPKLIIKRRVPKPKRKITESAQCQRAKCLVVVHQACEIDVRKSTLKIDNANISKIDQHKNGFTKTMCLNFLKEKNQRKYNRLEIENCGGDDECKIYPNECNGSSNKENKNVIFSTDYDVEGPFPKANSFKFCEVSNTKRFDTKDSNMDVLQSRSRDCLSNISDLHLGKEKQLQDANSVNIKLKKNQCSISLTDGKKYNEASTKNLNLVKIEFRKQCDENLNSTKITNIEISRCQNVNKNSINNRNIKYSRKKRSHCSEFRNGSKKISLCLSGCQKNKIIEINAEPKIN